VVFIALLLFINVSYGIVYYVSGRRCVRSRAPSAYRCVREPVPEPTVLVVFNSLGYSWRWLGEGFRIGGSLGQNGTECHNIISWYRDMCYFCRLWPSKSPWSKWFRDLVHRHKMSRRLKSITYKQIRERLEVVLELCLKNWKNCSFGPHPWPLWVSIILLGFKC